MTFGTTLVLGLKYLTLKKFKVIEIILIDHDKVYSHFKQLNLHNFFFQKIVCFKFNAKLEKHKQFHANFQTVFPLQDLGLDRMIILKGTFYI